MSIALFTPPPQYSLSIVSSVAQLSSISSNELLDLFGLFECATIRPNVVRRRVTSAGSTHTASVSCYSLFTPYRRLVPCPALAFEVHRYLPSLSFVQHVFSSSLPSWVVNGILSITSHLNVGPGSSPFVFPWSSRFPYLSWFFQPLLFLALVFLASPMRSRCVEASSQPVLAQIGFSTSLVRTVCLCYSLSCSVRLPAVLSSFFSVSQGLRLSDVCVGTFLRHFFELLLLCLVHS